MDVGDVHSPRPTLKMVASVDGKQAEEDDTRDIRATYCINCKSHFKDTLPIIFVRLSDKRLLWWHVHHCAFYRA